LKKAIRVREESRKKGGREEKKKGKRSALKSATQQLLAYRDGYRK